MKILGKKFYDVVEIGVAKTIAFELSVERENTKMLILIGLCSHICA